MLCHVGVVFGWVKLKLHGTYCMGNKYQVHGLNDMTLFDGTIAATLAIGRVLKNTMNEAAQPLPMNRVFSRLELYGFGRGCAYPQGVRRGFVHVLNTHAHPFHIQAAGVVSLYFEGAKTMQTQTTPKAATTGNAPTVIYNNTVDRHAAIENSLRTALHLVQNGKTIADIQRAMSRTMRASSLLKQTFDTMHVLKGGAA